jgi:hypothetical protein
VGVALVVCSTHARADAAFALSWQRSSSGPGCVTEAALRDGVEKKLHRDPFVERERADLVLEGVDLSTRDRFHARVVQRDRQGIVLGARDLDAQTCAGLLRATVLVVALFIEPDGPRPEPDTIEPPGAIDDTKPPGPSLPPSPPGRVVVNPSVVIPPATSERAPFALSLGVGAAAMVGLLPFTSGAVRLGARLERTGSRWSFAWSGGYSFPQKLHASASVEGTFGAIDQQVRACWAAVDGSSVRLDGCGGFFWGAIMPTTAGVLGKNDAWRPMLGPSATVELQLRDGGRFARIDLGIVAPPVRRALYYVSSEGVEQRFFTTSSVILFVGLSGYFTIF